MTHDPNNWTDPEPVLTVAATYLVSTCRRCGTVVLADWYRDDQALHDHWHDDLAHQLAQARA